MLVLLLLNGSGSEFADGDSVSGTGGASGTVSTGGVGTAKMNLHSHHNNCWN